MKLRTTLSALPLILAAACVDSDRLAGPAGPQMDVAPLSVTYTVEHLLDDGTPGSLRWAIALAANGHNIAFDPALAGGTIVVASELVLDRSVTIQGPQGGITISGGGNTRVFRVPGTYGVVLENLTIRDGYAGPAASFGPGGGALLITGGNVTIIGSTLEHNWADQIGGAIDNVGGALTIRNSTISYNGVNPNTGFVTTFAGGVRTFRGTTTISNSTISGNTASLAGGGIVNNQGVLLLTHTTIANNGAQSGGGIANFAGPDPAATTLVNSIVAGNHASALANGPDIRNVQGAAQLTQTADHSLVGTADGHELVSSGGTVVGANAAFVLDGFGKPLLADNGGPTATHALLPNSPAVDAAGTAACIAADQRGITRPQGGACDMGAFELQGDVAPPVAVTALAINSSATADRKTGVLYLTGTITCSAAGTVDIQVSASQQQKQRSVNLLVTGGTTVSVPCAGATSWAAAITAGNGIFLNSDVAVTAVTQNVMPSQQDQQTVKVFWGK